MAITYSYPLGTPKLTDTVLGVQYEEMKDPAVKNFSISDIANLAIEEIGNISQGPVGPQGPTGAQGVQGNAGTPGVVGPAGLEWQGVWDTDASYNVNDAVSFAGASYFCILNIDTVSNPFPDEDTTHWALLAAQGAQGIQGVQGPTGSQGPAGTISYTEESRNTSSLSIAQNPASTSSKITKNFTRAFVTSGANNFLGLSNIGKDTGDFYVVQNMSTTLDLVVVPLDGTRFLQPNGFASQINFTVKANTYARFTLADNTSGSDKVFMVEVIKPLGAAPTLQQVIDEGNTVSDGSNETMISGGSVIVTSSSNAANVSADNIFFEKQLGSGSVELKFLNTIDAARVINFPNASGTIALTSNIVTKVVKTTITEAQILQMFTTPIPILNSTTAGIAKIPLNILCKRSGAGTAYTIASNQFSLVSNSGNTFTISLNNNILSGAVPVSYTTFSSNANFQISVGVDDEIYKLGFYTSNPTGGTGDMDVYVTYIEITL